MPIQVKKQILVTASTTATAEWRRQIYLEHNGLTRREIREFQSQSDTTDYTEYRDSIDNGKTFNDWNKEKRVTKEDIGNDQLAEESYPNAKNVWNAANRHYLTLIFQTIYDGGYSKANSDYWSGGKGPIYHTFLKIENEDGTTKRQFITYEKGDDFSKSHYKDGNYLSTNIGIATDISILKNGDILFGLMAPTNTCCKIAGLDTKEVFPSAPEQCGGLLVFRGTWDGKKEEYSFTFSSPVIIDDRLSSRGISEPVFAELNSGKILAVLRGSNQVFENWGSRISPFAPSYKFYSISDDGGKTFSPPMPWHFDSREIIYSPATYSLFIRSTKNKKLYWIGNITEPDKTYGNHPRYPLYIAEVDDTWGHLIKKTLTVIDTKAENESEKLQLSNFSILEDRETGNIEILLSKLGQFDGHSVYDCECTKYTVIL